MWGKIIIPLYRLWLHSLYELYGAQYPLSSKRLLNLITHSLTKSSGRFSICVSDVHGTSLAIYIVTLAQSGHVDLQLDTNGSFVLNNNIFTILFLTPAITVE